MRALAADIGTVRLGMAVSDPLGFTAQPLQTQPGGGVKRQCAAILAAVLQYETARTEGERVGTVVIGHPLHLSGAASEMSEMAEECARRLEEYLRQHVPRPIQVVLWDERFTSVAAEREMLQADLRRADRRQKRDQVAAQLLLQSYLEAQRGRNQEAGGV